MNLKKREINIQQINKAKVDFTKGKTNKIKKAQAKLRESNGKCQKQY